MNIVQVGIPKRYGKFKQQAICIFSYEGWNIIIHPDILHYLANRIHRAPYQILFEGYGFCFTLLDGCGIPKTNSEGMKYTASLFNPGTEFDNWRGPYIGKGKYISDCQRQGFMKLRNILKSFRSYQAFVQIFNYELKYFNHVPHDKGYGISIGSRANLNPTDGKTPYNVFKKRWLLYKYGLDEPINNFELFHNKLVPKINSLNKLWRGSSTSAANRNDLHKYEIVKKKQMEEYNLKIKEINLKRKEIVKKYFVALKNYIKEYRSKINQINLKRKEIVKKYFVALKSYIIENKNKQKIQIMENDTSVENTNISKIMDITNSLECLIIHLKTFNSINT